MIKKLIFGVLVLMLMPTADAQNALDKIGLTSSNYASAAYSFRLLSTAYTGPLARITIGTNYYDVYPDITSGAFALTSKVSAALTTYNASVSAATSTTLGSIVSSSTVASVAVLYDQSGNNAHAVQAGTGSQPRIINAGAIDANNGNAAMTFQSAGQEMVCSSSITVQTISAVRSIPNINWQTLIAVPANTDFSVRAANGSAYNISPNANDWTVGTSPNQTWVNGTQSPTYTATTVHAAVIASQNPVTNTMSIGTTFLGRGMYGGAAVNELILFPTTLSTTVRQTIENNQISTYAVFLITAQPAPSNQSVSVGGTATPLSVTSGIANSTYQWYSNTSNSNVGGTVVSGATASTFTPPSSIEGTLYYYVVVSNTNVSAPSTASGYVRVGIEITTQPSATSQTVIQNTVPTALSVVATGSAITYQWYQNTTNNYSGATLIPGATASSYTPPTAAIGSTYYYVTVTGTNTLLTSNLSGAVTIVPPPPIISYTNNTQSFMVGTAITPLTITNTGGSVANNMVTTVATGLSGPIGLGFDQSGNMFVLNQYGSNIKKITPSGTTTTFASGFYWPSAITVTKTGLVYVSDQDMSQVVKITSAGVKTTISSYFDYPTGIASDKNGNVYVTDQYMGAVHKITAGGSVSGFSYSFNQPIAIATDTNANVYVTDAGSNQIAKMTPAGSTSYIGSNLISGAAGIAVDASSTIYLADQGGNKIWKVTPSGEASVVAGSGNSGSADATGVSASFSNPAGLTVDRDGNIFVADQNNNKIRKINVNYYSISPALPAGLTFNNTTGQITGTPTVATAATTYTVVAANGGGSSSTTLVLSTTVASGLDTNGQVIGTSANFINRNGAKGTTNSVNKNGKIVN